MEEIFVTKPSLPPFEELIPDLKEIWEKKRITNNGYFHKEFESKLAKYLGVKYVSLFCNGMIALHVGLQALRVKGEVITTPYTFPGTTHAIYWNRCTPVFCDICEDDFNIDSDKIESLISPDTTAIMPVHVYGNPCNDEKLREICSAYGLKLFYDAAHAFGVKKNGVSILNWGDLSMLSFHATKCFNTFEGGALITDDIKLKERIDYLKNFGFTDEVTIVAPGLNGKMNEFSAALGCLQLKYIDGNIAKTKNIANYYKKCLSNIGGIRIYEEIPGVDYNSSYFPILVDSVKYGISRDELYSNLKSNNIFARRYFYPLTSNFPAYKNLLSAEKCKLPIANKISEQILCLPIYPELNIMTVDRIIKIITDNHI